MGKFLLFPHWWRGSKEDQNYLKELQTMLQATNARIFIDCKYDKYKYIIRRQRLANTLRDKWKVIEGGLKEETSSNPRIIQKG